MALLIARHGMSYVEAARTTLVEFEVYNTAYAIKQEDIRFNAAIQAWYNGCPSYQRQGQECPFSLQNL